MSFLISNIFVPQNYAIMTIIIRNDADMIRWVLKAPERHPKLVGFGCEPAISVKAPKEIMEVI